MNAERPHARPAGNEQPAWSASHSIRNRYRHYTHGYYSVNGRHLYVNRGLSYGQRVLEWCRPEVTVFKAEPECV